MVCHGVCLAFSACSDFSHGYTFLPIPSALGTLRFFFCCCFWLVGKLCFICLFTGKTEMYIFSEDGYFDISILDLVMISRILFGAR